MLNDNCYTIVKLYSFICGIMEIIRKVFWCMNIYIWRAIHSSNSRIKKDPNNLNKV